MSALKEAINKLGGVAQAATLCGVSQRAIYKWLSSGTLPRTEYTGETRYASLLADASDGQFTAEWLLAEAAPTKTAAQQGGPKPAHQGENRRAPRKPTDRRGRRETDLSTQEARELLASAEKLASTLQRVAKD